MINYLENYGVLILKDSSLIPWMAFCLLAVTIDYLWLRNWRQKIGHDAKNILNGIFVSAIFVATIPLFMGTLKLILPIFPHAREPITSIERSGIFGTIVVITALFIAEDFMYYWWHRAQHHFSLLWRLHAVHHSDDQMNATTYVRQHWTEQVFQSFLISIPIFILFGPVYIPFAVGTAFIAWNFFIHIDANWGLGPISRIFNTPALHRVHHSTASDQHHSNYAGYFPFLDVLFGTYKDPRQNPVVATGVDTPVPGWQFWFLNHRVMTRRPQIASTKSPRSERGRALLSYARNIGRDRLF